MGKGDMWMGGDWDVLDTLEMKSGTEIRDAPAGCCYEDREILSVAHLAWDWSGTLRQLLGFQCDHRKGQEKAEERLPVLGDWTTWRPLCRKDFMFPSSGGP